MFSEHFGAGIDFMYELSASIDGLPDHSMRHVQYVTCRIHCTVTNVTCPGRVGGCDPKLVHGASLQIPHRAEHFLHSQRRI